MSRVCAIFLVCALSLIGPGYACAAVVFDTVAVGTPGNAADSTGFGSVAYNYSISKYEVTVSQWTEFLNAKDPNGDNHLDLYAAFMSQPTYGGIDYNPASAAGEKYAARPDRADKPIDFVSWISAARFANWLGNGQGDADTENGAYTIGPYHPGTWFPVDPNTIVRNSGATFVIPSEDEWYKSAYFNPAAGGYFKYPTSSDVAPIATDPTADPNAANYGNRPDGNFSDVGEYTGTTSPVGAYDMAGNASEWTERINPLRPDERVTRGGSFSRLEAYGLESTFWASEQPTSHSGTYGLRIAVVPEPSTLALAAIGALGLLACELRRRRVSH